MNTKENFGYTKGQLSILVLLRVLIGWHFLYEGIVKVLNPNWSSLGYLMDSQGFLSGFFHSLASNPNVLQVVDYLNMYGLLAIGLGLILGCFTQIATIAGMVLLALYYLSHIPFVGASYALPTDGSYLWVDKTLIELVALAVLFVLPTGRHIGLDRFIFGKNAD
ncbi:MAG: DoxX family membrane protein [Bacteroidales bacterium]|nr:DoxX family membrane protein [Bacteroidales bacterium]